MSTELLILVPARGGSTRIPRKNLRKVGGRSLLQRTQDAILEAQLNAPCILSTDDDEIAAHGRELGWLVPFKRPAELSGSTAPTVTAVLHCLDWYRGEHGSDPVLLMLLQPTSPFRGGKCLRLALDLIRKRPDTDAVIGVTRKNFGSARFFSPGSNGLMTALGEREEGPTFVPNGAMYLVRTAALRAQGTLYPSKLCPLEMDEFSSFDIDTEADLLLAETALASTASRQRLTS